jgi:hypothetical protein
VGLNPGINEKRSSKPSIVGSICSANCAHNTPDSTEPAVTKVFKHELLILVVSEEMNGAK